MKNLWRNYLRGLALASTIGMASAAIAGDYQKVVAAGQTLKVTFYLAIHADCTSIGDITVRVTQSPANGTVTTKKAVDFPNFAPTSDRAHCNSRRVPSVQIDYRPEANFVGSDSVSLDVIYPTGGEQQDSFHIVVK